MEGDEPNNNVKCTVTVPVSTLATNGDKDSSIVITPPVSKLNLTQDMEVRDTKKFNLLTVINKIQPIVSSVSTNASTITLSSTPTINNVECSKAAFVPNKRKSSPPVFVSKDFAVPLSLLQHQSIASATVSNQSIKEKPIFIDLDEDIKMEETPLKPPIKNNAGLKLDAEDQLYSDKVFSHMLDFLYKGLMARGEPGGHISTPQGGSDGPSLEMPEQKSQSKSDVEMLMKYMNRGTEAIKVLFMNEVNLIYECKRCRGLFRSVPNLVRHKKEYCKRSGITSNLLQQPDNKSVEEDQMMSNLLKILNPQDNPNNISLDFEQISSNKNAVYQRRSSSDIIGNTSFNPNVTMTAKTTNDRRNFTSYNPQVSRTPSHSQQYIILNQSGAKSQIARGSIKTVNSTGRNSLPANIMITSNGKIGALGGMVVDTTPRTKHTLNKSFTAIKSKDVGHASSSSNDPGSPKINIDLSGIEFKKKPKCPLCQKEMAERKNVKRHLISVHMMSVDETWKLMHKTMPLPSNTLSHTPIVSTARKSSSFAPQNKYSDEMDKLSVESIQVGPERKIKVLPKTYMFPDSYCPLCAKTMSSRNNVRRHMLETHDYLIQGDKKYYQIKLLLAREDTSQMMDGRNRSMRRFYGTSSNLDIEQIKVELEMYEAIKKKKTNESVENGLEVSTTTIIVSDVDQMATSQSPTTKQSPKPIRVSTPKLDVKLGGQSESEPEKTPEKQISKAEAKKMIDAASCKCLSCDDEFARRQTLKNHMLKTHQWSKDLFNSVYDDAYAKKSDDESELDSENEVESKESENDKENNHANKNENAKKEGSMGHVETTSLTIPVNKNIPVTKDMAGRKVVKTVLLQKVVSATPAASSTTLTDANKIRSPSASNVLAAGGIYVMKTNVQIVPTTQSSIQNIQENTIEFSHVNSKRKISSDENKDEPAVKKEKLFDIKSNTCCLCQKEFNNTSILKRHMIEIHSCTMEQVLGASRDTANVDPKIQKMGENLGYDIENAKCLLCSKYFFVRPALRKHLNKVHSYNYATLQGLESEDELDSGSESPKSPPDKKTYGLQLRNVVKKEANIDENGEKDGSNHSTVLLTTMVEKFSKESLVEKIVTEKAAQDALKILPSSMINAGQLKCVRCKQKYSKLWDLKEHILHHIGMGVYACRFCEDKEVKCAYNLELIMSHIQNDHPTVTRRSATTSMKNAKINNKAIWKAYGLPLRR